MFVGTKRGSALVLALCAIVGLALAPASAAAAEIDIPYQKFVLDNGLTLLVHEDHKAPIVAVNVWYHVGSKNEKPGRTGFAHLFEHLMFNGSENFNDDYFQAMARIGATDLNGTTNEDRTNYFQNVPTSAVDVALWMESDRMGHMLGAVGQEKLDEQRGVVQNEKRQWENQPYALAYELITEAVYPEGHPYSWTVIGSMDDLGAAELEDVHEWFKKYYGAANAVIAVAGDIDAETAKKKVEHYFGNIPSGPPVSRPDSWIAKRTGTIRQTAQDRVPHSRLYKVWNVPQLRDVDHDYLELVADVLASGKTSRLYKRLVYDEQIARDVSAYVDSREIGSLFQIEATAQPGVELAKIEKAIDEELERLIASGPTKDELERVKTNNLAGFIRGAERIGGFGGKSDILARSAVYAGSPDYYKVQLANMEKATPQEVKRVAREWLSDGVYSLEVHPFPDYATKETQVDRSKVPEPGAPPPVDFPEIKRAKLSNGLDLLVAERRATPLVHMRLLVDAGYAADQFGAPGTAQLAMNMMDEGTADRDALEISEQLDELGATLGTGSDLDMSYLIMTALKSNLDESLDLMADVALNPSFPQKEFDRLKKLQLGQIEQEKTQPFAMALRVFPGLLYGKEHAYGTPFTGSGTKESVTGMKREHLVEFHDKWFKPNNATLVAVGDVTIDELKPKLEKLFSSWEGGEAPKKNVAEVAHQSRSSVYLIDKPGAIQSVILAGHVAPPRGVPEDIAIETMNTILGGTFVSRLNMNLREDKHWSYGCGSALIDAQGQRPFVVFAPVQTDKTKESLLEVKKELTEVRGSRPVTDDEVGKIQQKQVLELPGTWETNSRVASAIAEMVRFDLAPDYFDQYASRVRSLSRQDVANAAEMVVHPDKLVWIVVGDREKVEKDIRDLGIGELKLMDADGKVLQ